MIPPIKREYTRAEIVQMMKNRPYWFVLGCHKYLIAQSAPPTPH
jgi:hypothetical protein